MEATRPFSLDCPYPILSKAPCYNYFMLGLVGVSFSVKHGKSVKNVLNDVTFSVNDGELVVITGPNGSGKSTLAKIIAGLEVPTSGKILLNNEDITAKSCTDRARLGIAFSFQQPVTFKGLTVKDLLTIAATGNETILSGDTDNIDKLLLKVGLDPELYMDRELNASLSGGEQKRIEIASVIARNADFTIFDEPEAGIDIWSFSKLINVFKAMLKENPKRSIIIISHQERIMKLADRIFVMEKGKIVKQGSRDAVLSTMEIAK